MKRTRHMILRTALLAAVGVFVQSAFVDNVASAAQPKKRGTGTSCSRCSRDSGRCLRCRGDSSSCTCDSCNGSCNSGHGPLRRAVWGMRGAAHSGQPLIDPWARADWIAAQRAANSSWHAGYYHTEWGTPVALMVSPTVRMHTRWGWGVAQSTMHPLYHQFERPYPGPVGGDAGMAGANPLLPTPRWPSHTDQFGVYYVRGPW